MPIPDPIPVPFVAVETANGVVSCSAWPGDGSAAVLLHGVNGSATSWSTIAGLVAGRRRLIAIDLRGRGHSPAEGPWGVGAHAADVVEVLTALAQTGDVEGPVTLVGHSFGAHVAAAAARRAPVMVAELLLVDGGPPRRIPADGDADTVVDGALANILPHLDGLPFPVSAEAVAADFASMVLDEESTGSLAATDQPLTMIGAGHGVAPGLPPIIDDDALAELTTARPVTWQRIDDATHFSLLGDDAGAVIDALLVD